MVLAKAPAPGRSKTRLCPPCTPDESAGIAEAALRDTLDAVVSTPGTRPVLVLDGLVGPWLDHDVEVLSQRGTGLDERLAAAFDDVGGSALLVGMDTPQVTPHLLDACARCLRRDGTDAVLGPAPDGGYWTIGLRVPDPDVFVGVPMSTSGTGAAQRARLARRGLRTTTLPALADVDHFADARTVAAAAPHGRFAGRVAEVVRRLEGIGSGATT